MCVPAIHGIAYGWQVTETFGPRLCGLFETVTMARAGERASFWVTQLAWAKVVPTQPSQAHASFFAQTLLLSLVTVPFSRLRDVSVAAAAGASQDARLPRCYGSHCCSSRRPAQNLGTVFPSVTRRSLHHKYPRRALSVSLASVPTGTRTCYRSQCGVAERQSRP